MCDGVCVCEGGREGVCVCVCVCVCEREREREITEDCGLLVNTLVSYHYMC